MKRENKTTEKRRDMKSLIAKLSEQEILTTEALSNVRGGDGEDDGGVVIIILPIPAGGH
jgi:hypothetical protein